MQFLLPCQSERNKEEMILPRKVKHEVLLEGECVFYCLQKGLELDWSRCRIRKLAIDLSLKQKFSFPLNEWRNCTRSSSINVADKSFSNIKLPKTQSRPNILIQARHSLKNSLKKRIPTKHSFGKGKIIMLTTVRCCHSTC